jgi:GntR family transcriptional regulator
MHTASRPRTIRSLSRESGVPLYLQIARRIRSELADRSRPLDEPLFTDEELARRFGVHRLTVRQAMKQLESEGLLARVRGKGTFLAPPKLRGEPMYLGSFVDAWSLQGRRVRVEVLQIEEEDADGRGARGLELAEGGPVCHVVRRRWVDDHPLVVDHILLPREIGRAVTRADLEGTTLHRAIFAATGRAAVDAELEIEATVARDDESELLDVPAGSPLLLRTITLLDPVRRPLSFGWSLYRADIFRYSLAVSLAGDAAYGAEVAPASPAPERAP